MKKNIVLVSFLLVLLFAFAGCGNSEPAADTADEVTADGYTIMINTDGMGQIAYAEEGEAVTFDDEFPMQSTQVTMAPDKAYVIGAKADEDWKFIKWTVNGEDYSTEEQITFTATEDAEIIAYFDVQ